MTRRHMFFRSAKPIEILAELVFFPLLTYPAWVLYFVFAGLFNPVQGASDRRVWQTVPVDKRKMGQLRCLFAILGGATLASVYRTLILWLFMPETEGIVVEAISYAGLFLFAASAAVVTSSILHYFQETSSRPKLMVCIWVFGLILVLLGVEQLLQPTVPGVLFVWIVALPTTAVAYFICINPLVLDALDSWGRTSLVGTANDMAGNGPPPQAVHPPAEWTSESADDAGVVSVRREMIRPFKWHAILFIGFLAVLPVLTAVEFLTPGAALGWILIGAYGAGEVAGRTLFVRIRCYNSLPLGQSTVAGMLIGLPIAISTIAALLLSLWFHFFMSENPDAFSGIALYTTGIVAFFLILGPLWLSNYLRLRGNGDDFFLWSLLVLLGCLILLTLGVTTNEILSPIWGVAAVFFSAGVSFILLYRQCGDDRRPRRMAIAPEED